MEKVSVIIPTWNREKTIKTAIGSALLQTRPVLEVLICDDGSTDNTEEIIRSIEDPRVLWLPGERAGRPAIPRNRGLKVAKGEWIAFLDSDDEWLPEKIEKQLQMMKAMNCKACSSNAKRLIPGKGIIGDYLSFPREKIKFKDLTKINEIICSSFIMHSSILNIVAGFPEEKKYKAIEDYALWLRIATQTDIAYIAESLIIYRDDIANSIRGGETIKEQEQRELVFDNLRDWLRENEINEKYEKLLSNNPKKKIFANISNLFAGFSK